MEIGTAIFLSSVFVSTVALYVATKDRWNWKKLILWPLGITIGLSVIGGAGFGINSWIQDQPRKELGFWGIKLGASAADVRFTKGEPTRQTDDVWFYKGTHDSQYFVIGFQNGTVRFIADDAPPDYRSSIQEITRYTSPDSLIKKFGQPSYISRSKDETSRWLSFEKFNVAFRLEMNEIVASAVYDSTAGAMKFSDEAK